MFVHCSCTPQDGIGMVVGSVGVSPSALGEACKSLIYGNQKVVSLLVIIFLI